MRRIAPLLLALLLPPLAAAEDPAKLRAALVDVDVSAQAWDQSSPWQKHPPQPRSGQGVVVEPGVVLTLARLVTDAQLVEVSVANSARRYPARVKHMDLAVGLALLEITDQGLRGQLTPMPVGEPAKLDDEFDLYQLGADNMLQRYTGRVVSASAEGARLLLRLNTTLSSGGDGQAAVRDGKLLGLMWSTRGQEGALLSAETIRRYLDDLADGSYAGPPGPGLWVQPLLRDDLRAYYGVAEEQHGIAITRLVPGRTGDGVLRENDVLLAIDGYDLDDEGRFMHEVHGRLDSDYLLRGRRNAGDRITARILREGEVREVELELRAQAAAEALVPDRSVTERPQFLVVGGLVLLPLARDQSFGRRSAGATVLRRYIDRDGWDKASDRKQVVYVDHVLADIANKGFETLSCSVVETVNGQRIKELADVAKALEAPQEGFHVFRFEGAESDFVIPAGKLAEIDKRIARTYKVNRLRYLAGDPG
jgi:S1-C subfamily serine protease